MTICLSDPMSSMDNPKCISVLPFVKMNFSPSFSMTGVGLSLLQLYKSLTHRQSTFLARNIWKIPLCKAIKVLSLVANE